MVYGMTFCSIRKKIVERYEIDEETTIKPTINTLIFQIDLKGLTRNKNKIWEPIEASETNCKSELFLFHREFHTFLSDTLTINVKYFGDKQYIKKLISSKYSHKRNKKKIDLDEILEKIEKPIKIKATISNSNYGTIRKKIKRIFGNLIDSEHVEIFRQHQHPENSTKAFQISWYTPLRRTVTDVWWSLVAYNTRDMSANLGLSTDS